MLLDFYGWYHELSYLIARRASGSICEARLQLCLLHLHEVMFVYQQVFLILLWFICHWFISSIKLNGSSTMNRYTSTLKLLFFSIYDSLLHAGCSRTHSEADFCINDRLIVIQPQTLGRYCAWKETTVSLSPLAQRRNCCNAVIW